MALCILVLFISWIIAGLIIFTISNNFSLLLYGSPILIPFQKVLAYYFYHSKDEQEKKNKS